LRAIADRGYYSALQIKACADSGIAPILPKPTTSGAKAEGRFDRSDFIYIAKDDEYQCPAGERAIYRFTAAQDGLQVRRYWSSACPQCPMKAQCTPSSYRRITRWKHEEVLEATQRRFGSHARRHDRKAPHRGARVRHVQELDGAHALLMRRLPNVSTEMSLTVLAYNLKRVLSILGFEKTMRAMQMVGA
jgi:hypothetical protein